jgi:hypothetical protein
MTTLIRDNLGRIAFSRARAAVFVSLRTPIYFYNLVAPYGWTQGRPLVVGGTLLATGIDAALAGLLRKPDCALMQLRIPVDLMYVGNLAIPVSVVFAVLSHVSDCLSEARLYLDATQRERDAEHWPLGEAGE